MLQNKLALAGLMMFAAPSVLSAPTEEAPVASIGLVARADLQPALHKNFPDPGLVQDTDGTWYSFATNGNGKNVQVAKAPNPSGPWTYIEKDLLPDPGSWTTGANTWAPDVRVLGNGVYTMYYSGQLASDSAHHCVGVATADNILGPYKPQADAWACPSPGGVGGAIDPSGYYDDESGRRYVTYKIDGNSVGHGGSCGNTVEPIVATPIMLQEVSTSDGWSKVGEPVQIFDRTAEDGPYVEAPQIIRLPGGFYILFYSNHCYTSPDYSVRYATSQNVAGPYTRAGPLIQKGDWGLTAPGGAQANPDGSKLLFHADCDVGRCLYALNFTWN